jgi:hypothetical protein
VKYLEIINRNRPVFFFELSLVQSSPLWPVNRFLLIMFQNQLSFFSIWFIILNQIFIIYILKKLLLSEIQNHVLRLNLFNLLLNHILCLTLIIFISLEIVHLRSLKHRVSFYDLRITLEKRVLELCLNNWIWRILINNINLRFINLKF